MVIAWSWLGHCLVMAWVGLVMGWSWVGLVEPMTNPHQQKLYYWICMTNQTSPQLFRLQQAALRPAPPCTKSRASMSADEATGPSASTPGESFYSDWALIGQDGRTIGHASTPGASTPGDSTPGALPPPPAPLPVGASTPGASTPGASRDDPPQRRARQDWRPDPSPDRGCTRGALE